MSTAILPPTIDKSGLQPDVQTLLAQMHQLRLSGMADAFVKQMDDPNADLRSFMDRVTELVGAEWQLRYNKKLNRYAKRAKLRYPQADLDASIYEPDRKLDTAAIEQLATCHWIDEGRSLLITGLTGSGKTYLANALCVAALRQLRTVRYVRASTLLEELARARLDNSYLDILKSYTSFELLAIDDFGLMDLDPDKCRDFFEVIDGREGRRSTIVISQYAVSKWYDMFNNQTYADACLSRLTDKRHSYRLEMNGVDLRQK